MLKTFGIVEDEVLKQMQAAIDKSVASHAVLCADNHLGYSIPVGGVVADVLKAHEGTVKIIHNLAPMGVAMCDGRTYDPFKD